MYCSLWDDHVYAVDVADGTERWSEPTGGAVHTSPTIADETLYVGNWEGEVLALDPQDGSEIWTFSAGDTVRSSPTVANGTVFVGSHDGNVYALDTADGNPVAAYQTSVGVRSSPTIVDGRLFVGGGDHLYALDVSDISAGSSEDSRVHLGSLGHHDVWTTHAALPHEPALERYANEDGVIDTDGLRDAADHWRAGEIDTDLLRDVVEHWRSGQPIEED